MASGYKFSLQKLLEIREEKEEESKRLFTDSQRQKQITENELNNMRDSYDKYKGIRPGEDVIYQKIKRNYLLALESGIKSKEKELVVKSREVEVRRIDLKQRQVDRKIVETLKEKQYRAFIKEQDRIEQINNDEFALYAYMRNLKGGE
ncbi:flagellar export protein FliJ [Clostridium paraputrificum]|uniref:flagellar export protein FliJ n=1 Tax=Clostridium paraputrificum TaxID=29363 RepID=UPI00066518CB|nr:flagellar export protein FliJ [Clostridium paraputrificum]MDB2105246.1 flagellar export protein FliJ [Clostridium paraputrificum]MDB2112265.1 flagellar export protein FliJ [Clostridium paraputrificum]